MMNKLVWFAAGCAVVAGVPYGCSKHSNAVACDSVAVYYDTAEACVDTVPLDDSLMNSSIPKVDLSECDKMERVDGCKYSIVEKDGAFGLFDMSSGKNITRLEYSSIRFRNRVETEEGWISYFVCSFSDGRSGILAVVESTDYTIFVEV